MDTSDQLAEKVARLERENASLRQELDKLAESQVRALGDQVYEVALGRLKIMLAPAIVVLALLGFLGWDQVNSVVEKFLIQPQIVAIIDEQIEDQVETAIDDFIEQRVSQESKVQQTYLGTADSKNQAVRPSSSPAPSDNALIDKWWLIAGSSVSVADIISERGRVERQLTRDGVNYIQRYPEMRVISTVQESTGRPIYALAMGPFDDSTAARSLRLTALKDGFRDDIYVRQLATAQVLPDKR